MGLAINEKSTKQCNYYQVLQRCRRQCIALYMNLLWLDHSQLQSTTVKTSSTINSYQIPVQKYRRIDNIDIGNMMHKND